MEIFVSYEASRGQAPVLRRVRRGTSVDELIDILKV